MTRRAARFLSIVALVAFSQCGKKGPILAPLARVPQPVQGLSLAQRGNTVILRWTNPTTYIDGNAVKEVSEVEIWLIDEEKTGPGSAAKPAKEEFEKRGRLVLKVPKARFASLEEKNAANPRLTCSFQPEAGVLVPKALFFSLRARDEKKRASAFSEPVMIAVGRPPSSPQDVRAAVFADHIEVHWKPSAPGAAPVSGFNVYRSEGETPPVRLNSEPVPGTEYLDKEFSFGKSYRYYVRAAASAAPPVIESDDSETVVVEAKDTFPPAPPQGLTAIAGDSFMALSWEPGRESDLAGYRVWRRTEKAQQFILVKELPSTENSFSDTAVEKNTRYVYAITAFDQAGNESPKSEAASGLIRRGPA